MTPPATGIDWAATLAWLIVLVPAGALVAWALLVRRGRDSRPPRRPLIARY